MTEVVSLKEAFKVKRDIDDYVEKWENTNPKDDPLLEDWKKHIEETKRRKTKSHKITPKRKGCTC